MDPFNIYLQTLLSQALDSDFLKALQQESGKISFTSRLHLLIMLVKSWAADFND